MRQHTNASKHLKNVMDMALESLGIILYRTNTFGYHTGTHGARKWHSIEFLNKTFHSNPQMKYYKNTWYPSSTQNLSIKE